MSELAHRRLRKNELLAVSNMLYEGVALAGQIDLPFEHLPKVIFHHDLGAAEEMGQFRDFIEGAIQDPALHPFMTYQAYVDWLRQSDVSWLDDVLKGAQHLCFMSSHSLSLYIELMEPNYPASTCVTPLWDIVAAYDGVRVLSRADANTVPWDMADGSPLPSFLTVSIPVLVRQLASRSTRVAQ